MWKKIGSIGPASNDNKSSRSKDQNAYQPFSQMSKIRVSDSQLFFDNNELFCPSYLGKKKGLQSKCFSQSRIQTAQQLQQFKSLKQLPQISKPSTIKKKILDRDQADELKLRISQKLIDGMDDSLDRQQKAYEQQNLPATESTEILCNENSIDEGISKLKHVNSTPEFNFIQIGQISEEISFDRKIEVQKNIKSLKKQHAQIKKTLTNQLNHFKKSFKSVETQIKNQISKIMENTLYGQSMQKSNNIQVPTIANHVSLNFEQITVETKNFSDKFRNLNKKKAEMMNKLISLRGK